MTTSEPGTRRRKSGRPSAEPLRSIAIERLLRFRKWKLAEVPAGMPRDWSPSPGRSTLITSAPRSARSSPAEGPAMMWPSSRTRTPWSGSGVVMTRALYRKHRASWLRGPDRSGTVGRERSNAMPTEARRWLWILLLPAASVFVTLGMACATPFAALATLAALHMSRRDGLALIGIAWLADQAVGYGLLGYPRTANSVAWGVILGVSAFAALLAARALADRLRGRGGLMTGAAAFVGGFVAYEAVLVAATAVLASGADAFSLPIVGWVLRVNLLSLAGLLILHRLAVWVGLGTRASLGARATVTAGRRRE